MSCGIKCSVVVKGMLVLHACQHVKTLFYSTPFEQTIRLEGRALKIIFLRFLTQLKNKAGQKNEEGIFLFSACQLPLPLNLSLV